MFLFQVLLYILPILAQKDDFELYEDTVFRTDRDEFPWIVSLYVQGEIICSGALVSPQWIICSAHCLTTKVPINTSQMRRSNVGAFMLDESFLQNQVVHLERGSNETQQLVKAFVHEEFLTDVGPDAISDISVAMLKEPVPLSDTFRPICLPNESEHYGKLLNLASYGIKNKGFKKAEVKTWKNSKCRKFYKQYEIKITSNDVCASGLNGTLTCECDDGGILFSANEDNHTLIGLATSAYPTDLDTCQENFPVRFVKVLPFKSWMLQFVADYSEDYCTGANVSFQNSSEEVGFEESFPSEQLQENSTNEEFQSLIEINSEKENENWTNYSENQLVEYAEIPSMKLTESEGIEKEDHSNDTHSLHEHVSSFYDAPLMTVQQVAKENSVKKGSQHGFPWEVAIYANKEFVCTGAILSPKFIFSAAHCVANSTTEIDRLLGHRTAFSVMFLDEYDKKTKKYTVYIGGADNLDEAQSSQVRTIMLTTNYKENKDWNLSEDIALFMLRTPVEFTNTVMPICLLNSVLNSEVIAEPAYGDWGEELTARRSSSEAYLKVWKSDECNDIYENVQIKVTHAYICAKVVDEMKTCHGDPGGLLFIVQDGYHKLLGITSMGSQTCETGFPIRFLKIDAFKDWILFLVSDYDKKNCKPVYIEPELNITESGDLSKVDVSTDTDLSEGDVSTDTDLSEGDVSTDPVDYTIILDNDNASESSSSMPLLDFNDKLIQEPDPLPAEDYGTWNELPNENLYTTLDNMELQWPDAVSETSVMLPLNGTTESLNEDVFERPTVLPKPEDHPENYSQWENAQPVNEYLFSAREKTQSKTPAGNTGYPYVSLLEQPKAIPYEIDQKFSYAEVKSPYKYPFVVTLNYIDASSFVKKFVCAGALITSQYVVTAAHCLHYADKTQKPLLDVRTGKILDNDYVSKFTIGLGVNDREHPEEEIFVSKIIIHTKYNPHPMNSLPNDIMLLMLQHPIKFTGYISPACLPNEDIINSSRKEIAIVVGWSRKLINNEVVTNRLVSESSPQIWRNSDCAKLYAKTNIQIFPYSICVGGEQEARTCKGDQGGIFVKKIQDKFYVLGITSMGPLFCGPNLPVRFTKTLDFIRWISVHSDYLDGFC